MAGSLDLSKFNESIGAGLAKPKEASPGPLPLAQKAAGAALDYLTTPSRAPSTILANAARSLSSAYSAKVKADYAGKDPYEQYLQGAKDRNAVISKVFSMAAQTIQSPFRAGATVGLSAAEAATGRKQDLYFSGNPILKKLVGAEDIRSIQTRREQGGAAVMGYGGSPLEAKLYPVAGMVASAALDFTGTGSSGKKVLSGMGDDLVEYLARETDEKAIARTLSMKGMRSSEAKALSAQFAKATDRKGVQEIADSVLGAEARKAAVESQIPDDFDPAAYAREQIAAREAAYAGEKKGAIENAKDIYGRMKSSNVDATAPIEDPIAREAKRAGIEFSPSKDIHNQIDVAIRSDGAARMFLKDSGFDRAVQEVSRMGDEALPLFDQYLVARHATDLSAAGIRTGRDIAKDAAFLKEYTPMFERHAADMTAYSQKLLDYSVERGLIAPELAARLKEIYPNYVPMNRVFSEIEREGSQFAKAGGVASLSKQDIVQRIEGSVREVENPMISLMDRTYKAFAQGETNKAAQMLVDAGKQLPELGIRNIGEAKDLKIGEGSFFALINGKKQMFAAPEAMAAAARSLNQEQLNTFLKLARWYPRIKRIGITALYPPFVFANFAKDQIAAAILSKDGLKNSVLNPFVFVPALMESLNHGKLYDEFMRSGASTLSYDMSRGAAKASLARIAAGRSKAAMAAHIIKTPKEWLRAIENGFGITENLTRMQQYIGTKKRALKAGMSEADAIAEAARAARENTANFARGGSYKGAIGALWLYMNANIQGGRVLVNALEKRPVETAAKIAGGLLFPVAAITAYNMSDPDTRAVYDEIKDYEKDNNIIFVPPGAKGVEDVYKFPFQAGINQLTIPVRKAIEAMHGLGEVSFADLAQGLLGSVSPLDISSGNKLMASALPEQVKLPAELMSNYNFFTESPIVPVGVQNKSPALQVRDGTSGTARKIGAAVDMSPIKIEHIFKSVFGGLGTYSLNLSDRILAGQGLIPKDQIGGKTMAEAVASRFKGAAGGRVSEEMIKAIQEALVGQEDSKAILEMEAEALYKELSDLQSYDAMSRLDKIGEKRPDLKKAIINVAKEEKAGLMPEDRFMMRLNVTDGSRAKFIAKKAAAISDKDKRDAYFDDLIRKKIITKTVGAQIGLLLDDMR